MKSVYLDNAATSWPKPPGMVEALAGYYTAVGASAGRGSYHRAMASANILYETREKLAKLFNVQQSEQFVFTLNATMALNLAIKGVLAPGDRVVTSAMEHNSVLRPLEGLKERIGIAVNYVPASAQGLVNPQDFARELGKGKTKLVALVHASNVCGAIQPIAEVGKLAKEHGALFLVDAAQTAGLLPLDFSTLGADMVAFPGHKGLLGPLGTGALWIRPGLDIIPLVEGGTGSQSALTKQPPEMPERCEAGSHDAAGIAGLGVAVDYIIQRGEEDILSHERRLAVHLHNRLKQIKGISVLGPTDPAQYTGVTSFTVQGYDPAEVGMLLDSRYDIMVRTGLHCAPRAHQALGTYATGSVRASVGPFSTDEDVDSLLGAMNEICCEVK
jgi:cysteine desulfurase family protein